MSTSYLTEQDYTRIEEAINKLIDSWIENPVKKNARLLLKPAEKLYYELFLKTPNINRERHHTLLMGRIRRLWDVIRTEAI